MGIDWITVAAQIVNFLVLAWLLKRFLYRPVVNAMQKREEGIASRLARAEERERQAEAEAAAYLGKMAEIDREREMQLSQAREVAERERHLLLSQARAEARASRERWQQDLAREQADFDAALVRETAEAAIHVARRALADLADARLEAQVVAAVARRLHALPDDERRAFAEAAPPLRLATAFELEDGAIAVLREALADTLGKPVELEWVRKPDLLFGIELMAASHKLTWSATAYLDEIAQRVRTSIDETRQATHEPLHEPLPAAHQRAPRGSADASAPPVY
jgi:F-type H+-transporting ATPase subunit b